jgi:hypothetical protein
VFRGLISYEIMWLKMPILFFVVVKDNSSCQDLHGEEHGAEEEHDGSAIVGNSSVPFTSSLLCTQDLDRGSSFPLSPLCWNCSRSIIS